MPDPTEQQEQQGDPVAPPANPTPNPLPTDPTPGTPVGDPPETGEGLKKALDAERQARAQAERDAKARGKELADAQAKLKAVDDAQKTAAERAVARAEAAEKRATDLEASLRQQALRHAVTSAARDQNFRDPDDAMAHLNLSAVEFEEDGTPKGVADLVKQLAKDKDYLVAPKSTVSGPPPTPTANGHSGPTSDELKAAEFALHTRHRHGF